MLTWKRLSQLSYSLHAYVDSTAPSAVAAAKPALPTVEMHRQLTPTAANSGNLFSDGNREPEATKHSHHVRLPPTGKKKQRARFAQFEQPATFTEDSSNNSDDSSVAEMGAATEADLRTLTSGRSSDSNTKIAAVKQTLAKDYDPGESYYVWGELHKDVPAVLFVVDTGAMVSMINKAVFDEIPLAQQPEIKKNYMELKSVTTQEVPTHGIVTLTVNVQGKFLEHDFWLCDMSESGVIGMDLLREHRAMIDLAHDKLILGDKLIRVSNSKGQRVHSKIVARTATVVPPGREMVIPAKVYNKRTRGRTGFQACAMVEPARGIHRQTGAIVARVLVAANKAEVPVRVFNPCDKPITINKFTMLGKLNTPEGIRHYQHPDDLHELPDEPATAAINKVTATSGVAAATTPKEGNTAATPAQQHFVAVAGVNVPAHLKTLYEQSTQQLKEEHKQMVAKLLCDYSDVFAKSPTDLGKTHLVQHIIDTGQEKPIQERVRRFPYEQSKEIEQQVKTMKEQGIIQESNSRWASNVVLVKKKDGTWRMCVDYRRLNAKTKNSDPYMLPRIDETLDRLSNAKFFSTLDLLSGYHQVELSADSKGKTAFIVPRMSPNHWEFKMMPFGLAGAPRTFQRLIDQLLRGLEYEVAMAYLDDIIVFSKTVEQMIERLRIVFQRLRVAGLKLKAKKCALLQTETIYLGHVISAEGVSCDPEKVSAVQRWVAPRTVKQVRAFLGTVGYYKRFIKNYADIARPLYELTKKNYKFVWTQQREDSFQLLKQKLISAPIMAYPQEQGDLY